MKEEKKIWEKSFDLINKGKVKLGSYFTYQMMHNTRHLLYALSRYKFASKMLVREPAPEVLELGCSEGIGSLILAENSSKLTAVDFHGKSVEWAQKNVKNANIKFIKDDFLSKKYGNFDAVVAIDVIEHINSKQTNVFLKTIINNLKSNGFCVIGTPNISARKFASPESKVAHVNLFTHDRLRQTFAKFFENIFLFGMNDEVIHTGFEPMCHYLFVLACLPKRNK